MPGNLLRWMGVLAWIGLPAVLTAAPQVAMNRQAPCNLFNAGEPVKLELALKEFPAGKAEVSLAVVDHAGKTYWQKSETVEVAAGKAAVIPLNVGILERGYYELRTTAKMGGTQAERVNSFGVMEFVNRTAKEGRDGKYVFGLKWWGGIKNQREMWDAMAKLGLQWTRIIQNESGVLTTAGIVTEYPINAVIKVERFPKELYDDAKYGPMADWEKKYGRGSWVIKSLPKKEAYQQWLRGQLSAIPKEQQVFEIWNEPWDKMSPQDFATLCGWIVEAILKDRPDAIIGPNLLGSTSPFEYDAKVVEAGGLKGMKMVALHPYINPEDRAWIRKYRQWLKEKTGRDMEVYITEYGSHSTPEGPAKRSEIEQCRRIARQSLILYSEGVSALLPHWAGQAEKDRTYIEDWFGFVRKDEEPKPVLLVHANSARLIDGSRYVGDLWLGQRVGAMVFEKKGTHLLALWTGGDSKPGVENTSTKEVVVDVGVPEVVLTDMFGHEKKLKTDSGKVTVTLDEGPVYLVGVNPSLEKRTSKELRDDLWPKPEKPPRRLRVAGKLPAVPVFDGKFDDWKQAAQLSLVNPKVNGYDCSGTGYIAWDDQYLYIGADMRDNEMLNRQTRDKLFRHDSMELFVSAIPRDEGSGFGPTDFQFFLAPTSTDGKPVVAMVKDREAGVVVDVPDAKFFGGLTAKADRGWALEVAIPWSALGSIKPAPGTRIAVDARLNDADTSHERFKIDPEDSAGNFVVTDPSSWSLLELKN